MVRMGVHACLNDITQFLRQEMDIEDQTQTGQLVQHQTKATTESRNSPERGCSTDSSDPIEKLKMELEALRRQSELSELEKKSLRKQAIKESKRIQEFSREVSSLKGERDGAVEECEKLRLQKSREADAEIRLRCVSEDSSNMIEEIRDELSCEKDLTSNLKLQLQRTLLVLKSLSGSD